MTTLLEITGEHIANLSGSDLRSLIGLLCEADYRSAGLRTKGIMWGGNQNAQDGGLDVLVQDEISPPVNSFVPRKITGFQVKKSDMPRKKILEEMKFKGVLRKEIKSLIDLKGAYVIVSSKSSTTNTALKNRINAMKEAVNDEKNACNLHLEFLDQGRIATWVRSHPSLILWVRNKINKPLRGWQPYGNWAKAPSGIEEEYLLDNGLRLHNETKPTEKGLSVEDGLLKLRSTLSTPGTSVRLTGLSGVGKTHLVQALFDQRIGKHALNCSQVFYADISDSPLPIPNEFAKPLVDSKVRAILIIDNCPPDLHRSLTEICSGPQSTVSLLTVEYDIRDDFSEQTDVFRLEPASKQIIKNLIGKRFPHISNVDLQTITNFSGGNARIAILLANTVQKSETPSGLRDEELFNRLFWQRHDREDSLLASAEVCALVYSFEGTNTNSDDSELEFLASLINKSGTALYRDVAELKRRDLVQSRGTLRAVLPHAVANRLAKRALESMPKEFLMDKLLNSNSDRLIKSFAHRLSYLHDCDAAIEIVDDLLRGNGRIGESMENLGSLDICILKNIAPVSPVRTLNAIERTANGNKGSAFTSRKNPHYDVFVRLLRHLAYEAKLFDRSVGILCRYALSENKDKKTNYSTSAINVLKSLFYIYLSGTHAPVESRAKVIKGLVDSEDRDKQELGLLLLEETLRPQSFSVPFEFGFGARSRNFGYHPETREEIAHWFTIFIYICTQLVLSDRPIAEQARKLLAKNFYILWTQTYMFDDLEKSAKQIHGQKAWNYGWLAVCDTIRRYNSNDVKEEILNRLHQLEKALKPDDLLEKARTLMFSNQHEVFTLEEDFNPNEDSSTLYHKARESARNVGAQVAQDRNILNALLPDLVTAQGTGMGDFGVGLADGCTDKQEFFQVLHTALGNTDPEKRKIVVILGFLSSCAESAPAFYNSMLDKLIKDDVLGEHFLLLQTAALTIDQRGIKRLHEALDFGKAKIQTFNRLALIHGHEYISDDDLAQLLRKILSKEGGISVVIENLQMRFYDPDDERPDCSDNLMALAREALLMYSSHEKWDRNNNQDHHLARIADLCLNGQDGIQCARQICQDLSNAIMNHKISSFHYPDLLNSLAQNQTKVFLDAFLLGEYRAQHHLHRRIFSDDFEGQDNPFNQIAEEVLISWCEIDSYTRYPLLASVIDPFRKSDETGKYQWKTIVFTILEKSPDLSTVFEHLADAIRPRMWGGSLADILEKRAGLFLEFSKHKNPEIRAWSGSRFSRLQEEVDQLRRSEDQFYRKLDGSFE